MLRCGLMISYLRVLGTGTASPGKPAIMDLSVSGIKTVRRNWDVFPDAPPYAKLEQALRAGRSGVKT